MVTSSLQDLCLTLAGKTDDYLLAYSYTISQASLPLLWKAGGVKIYTTMHFMLIL